MSANTNVDHDMDLPLMANAEVIRARHYIMRLAIDLGNQCVNGEVIVFLEPVTTPKEKDAWNVVKPELAPSTERLNCGETEDDFVCKLDCCDIDFASVQKLIVNQDAVDDFLSSFEARSKSEAVTTWFSFPRCDVNYKVTAWSVDVNEAGCKTVGDFPRVLYFRYRTRSGSRSLAWRKDSAGQECVFTPASAVNNRALFPCQEPPIAMATWQAVITAPKAYTVLCTGDAIEERINMEIDSAHYFYAKMVLPMSTFALAIGRWRCVEVISQERALERRKPSEIKACHRNHDPYPCHIKRGDSGPLLPCRLFGTSEMLEVISHNWTTYIPACLEAAYAILGSHPFDRVDILIVPRCFSGLGLASPNLIFLSQSLVLNGDTSMLVRVAHEVSHAWFGLVIGALDWTEQWLSEGFATFVEDHIHSQAMKVIKRDHPDKKEFLGYSLDTDWAEVSRLRALIRYKTLCSELDNTDEDLQKLRPMLGSELRDAASNALFVKNGMNPETVYTQVHYIKGYFLLRFLHDKVPSESFFAMLRSYIHDLNHGRLVHSTEFLTLFFRTFPLVDVSLKSVCEKWLDDPGLCLELKQLSRAVRDQCGPAMVVADREADKWAAACRPAKRKGSSQPSEEEIFDVDLTSEQIVLILERLLEEPVIPGRTLDRLESELKLSTRNADVQHRWCELIVKHRHVKALSCVKNFLINHQAMGIYLYGEMTMSSSSKVKRLASEIFAFLREEMDADFAKNVLEMISL